MEICTPLGDYEYFRDRGFGDGHWHVCPLCSERYQCGQSHSIYHYQKTCRLCQTPILRPSVGPTKGDRV